MIRLSGWAMKSLLSLAMLLMSGVAFGGKITVTGTVPKDPSRIDLTLTVTGITEQQVLAGTTTPDPADEQANLAARFAITLDGIDSSPLKYTAAEVTGSTATSSANAYVQFASPHLESGKGADNFYSYTYYISIIATSPTFSSVIAQSNSIKVRAKFFLGNTAHAAGSEVAITDPDPTEIKQEAYAIAVAPKFAEVAVVGSHKQLTVNWTPEGSVDIKPSGSREPSGISVFVVDTTVVKGSVGLSARIPSLKFKVADENATCTFVLPSAAFGECVPSCVDSQGKTIETNTATIDAAALAKSPPAGFKIYPSVAYKAGTTAVPNLENGRNYWVFMQYQPDGLARTLCYSGTPSRNYTLTELNGEGEGETVDFRCFIATAAYGTPLHDDVRLFRKFRDDVLLKSSAGRAFVDVYYEYGPIAADFIARHESLRTATRRVLEGPAWILRKLEKERM